MRNHKSIFLQNIFKSLAANLPPIWQSELKRLRYRRQIKKNSFLSYEPEFNILENIICDGDWVIDIGANVGHYTKRFSDLVGPHGRVIAFEPVSETFALLSANVQFFKFNNVTLFNAAASNENSLAGIQIPKSNIGLRNFYEARIETESTNIDLNVLTLRLDCIQLPARVSLIKIDTEGYELFVLEGIIDILCRDHPVLIIETNSDKAINLMGELGYTKERLLESPNMIFRPT